MDNKEFGKYLSKIREDSGFKSQRRLAQEAGVSPTTLSRVEAGTQKPSPETLKALSLLLKNVTYQELLEKAGYLDFDYLRNQLVHEGLDQFMEKQDMETFLEEASVFYVGILIDYLKKDGNSEEVLNYFGIPRAPLDARLFKEEILDNLDPKSQILFLLQMINFVNKKYPNGIIVNKKDQRELSQKDQPVNNVNKIIRVPVLGYIAAGNPVLAEEHIEEWTDIPNLWHLKDGEVFILRVKGDSMIGSRIYEGDKVLVKIQPDVENGEIAVVNVNGYEATLKKVKKYEDGSIWLISSNEKYAPIPLKHDKARIIGKVIQVMFEPE